MAEYLASVNLSKDELWDYPLKTLPRPTVRATRVVITEYDLPRKQIQPHDAIVDADGMVWFTHFGEQFLGKLDPKTGQVSEYPLPVIKPGYPIGTLDLETDKAGNLWIAMMYQGGVAKFDKATQKFQTWRVPDQWQTDATQQAFLSPTYSDVDGKVWVKNSDRAQILRLDPVTGQWENLGSFKDANNRTITSYGIPADHDNNLYLLDFSSSNIGKLDAKTGKLTVYRSPVPNSRPRVRGVPFAEDDQYPPRVRGQLDQPGELLGRQQSRRLDRQSRTTGLRHRSLMILAARPMFT